MKRLLLLILALSILALDGPTLAPPYQPGLSANAIGLATAVSAAQASAPEVFL